MSSRKISYARCILISSSKKGDYSNLHKAAATGTLLELKQTVISLGPDASLYAKQYMTDSKNPEGKLPIQLMLQNANYYKTKNDFHKILEPLTLDQTIPPLNQQLDEKELKQKYPKANKILMSHLSSAYSAINEVRKTILQSETHPDTNLLDQTTRTDISEILKEMRSKRKKKLLSCANEEEKIPIIADFASKYEVGNCQEYAYSAAEKLKNKVLPNTLVEIFQYVNGDHVFVVIGRDPKSNPSDYTSWGPHAVICDAWGGNAFPAKDAPSQLKCYFNYTLKDKNVVLPFDPNFHQLKVRASFIQSAETSLLKNSFLKNKKAQNDSTFNTSERELSRLY